VLSHANKDKRQRDRADRIGKYGDDGVLENERADIQPGETPGTTGAPTGQAA